MENGTLYTGRFSKAEIEETGQRQLVLGIGDKILLGFGPWEECIGVRNAVQMMEISVQRQHRTKRKGFPCRDI